MRAGKLRDRITIQSPVQITEAGWGPSKRNWPEVAVVWAEVEPLTGDERTEAGGVQGVGSYRISIRYRPNLTSESRLVYRGRVLDIVSVIDVGGRRRELQIEARERAVKE